MKCYTHYLLHPFLLFSSACFGQTYQDYINQGKAEKDPVKRITYFTQAISVNKTDSAFLYRGGAKILQNQYAEAIVDFDQAIRLNPDFSLAYTLRGQVKSILEKYEEAMADLDFAINLDKKNADAYSSRGYVKFDLGNYADAVFDLNRAIEINPNYSKNYRVRGRAYSELGKRKEALADFEQVIKLDPGSDKGYFASGIEKILLGRYQDAIPDFDQAIKIAPKEYSSYNGRGYAQESLGKYAAAIADYDQALKLNPDYKLAINNKNRAIKLKNAFAANQYNAEPLGYKLGVTPLSAIKQKDDEMQEDGYSKWTGGKKFTSKGTAHNIEGAKSITYIFNKEDLLDAIIIFMHKDYFDKINSYVKSKYKFQSATLPPVGDKYAKYIQGNSIIELDAPHLSFEMEVIYKTVAFDTAFKNKKLAEISNKTAEQKSKF